MATDEIKQTIVIEASLTKIKSDLKNLEGDFKTTVATINQVFSTLGIGLSAAAVINFVKTSVSEIGKLQDVFEQTGISADLLLKLKPILENTGSSVEEFASSVNAMQKSLVDGSADTIAAFKKVGIAADEILKLAEDPEELLDRVAKGLKNVATQTERVAIARELASRAGARIAPTLLELAKGGGVEGLRKTEGIISKEDIAAIDEAGDALNTLKISAEALAAVSFVGVFNGLKDIVEFASTHPLTFAFSPAQSAGTAIVLGRQQRQQIENVTKRESVDDADARAAVAAFGGKGTGLTETNAQRDFKKSLDEQIQSLKSQVLGLTSSKEAAIANAAEIIKSKAATIGLTESSEELTKRLNEFKSVSLQIAQGQLADQLTKANQSIEIQIATMTQGKQAAEALALKYTLLDAKLQNIGPAAEEAAKRQQQLNDELARAVVPDTLKELDDTKIAAQKGQVTLGITFNADEEVCAAIQRAIDKLRNEKDPRAQALAFEAALKLKPELDTATLKSIKTELGTNLGLDKEFSQVLNQTFTNTLDLAGEKVRGLETALQQARRGGLDPMSEGVQKLARDLDQAKFDQSTSDLNRNLELANAQAAIFGRSFDLAGVRLQAVESSVNGLLGQGLKPSTEEAQKLADRLRNLKVGSISADLQKGLEDIQNEAKVLGGAVDLPAESVNKLTDAIKRLIAEGIDPLDPKLQDLKAQIEDAKAAEHFAEAFQGIGTSFIGALQDLADGGKIKDVAKRLASNINRAITDALITRPFEEWIKKQTNDLFGPLLKLPIPGAGTAPAGQGVGIPGAAVQIAGAANQTQPAIAQTAIQALSTEATAVIQASSVTAQTAITTLGATTEASITALQAVAITAIQAAAAGQGAAPLLAGGANIGSLFSGGSAAAGAAGSTFTSVGAGEIFSTFPVGHAGGKVELLSAQRSALGIFHDGGPLKPGERMIIAENGEYVIKKQTAMKIGLKKLEQLNRDQAMIMPRRHSGGLVDQSLITSVPQWSSGRTNAPSSSMGFRAATIPDNALITTGMSRRQNGIGPSANIANFYNPQFQDRRSVGQTSAQLVAAMDSGKRNR